LDWVAPKRKVTKKAMRHSNPHRMIAAVVIIATSSFDN
jgi:hypothetical protein